MFQVPEIILPPKLVPVFDGPARYRGAYGGRGGAKSQSFSKMLLLDGMIEPMPILCGREYQNSIKDSVHSELINQIDFLNLHWFYKPKQTYIAGRNGTEINYTGFWNNLSSLRGKTKYKRVYIDEAEYISELTWEVLDPTIREENSEIWATWNPEREDSPTKKRLVDDKPDNAKVVPMGWQDNPWFPKILNDLRLRDKRRDYEKYLWIWEGHTHTRSDAQIFKGKFIVEAFTPDPKKWHGPYFGADWGFSEDPTVLMKIWIYDGILYIEQEAYGNHVESRAIGTLFDQIAGARGFRIDADCSRPETISEVKNQGFRRIVGCEKWDGSVEDGIEHMRGQYEKIVIHPRCVNTAKEFVMYSYKIDRLTQIVLVDIVDKHNHCIDAIRYALGPLIKKRNPTFLEMDWKGKRR